MDRSKMRPSLMIFSMYLAVLTMASFCSGNKDDLRMNFYSKSCPELEDIVQGITWRTVQENPVMEAKLVRLHYHDCFVRGCDASILLDPVEGQAEAVEKQARPNQGVTGYDVIDEIKAALEQVCPETVSCADIVALAAREAVAYQTKVPMWHVLTGRRDGNVSLASEAERDLPRSSSNIDTLYNVFQALGLDYTDLVALSGAHTIGESHCRVISRRLFNFSGNGDCDPSLDPSYADYLKAKCSDPQNPNAPLEMDPGSSLSFDNHYYVSLSQNKSLFQSDAALLTDQRTAQIARNFLTPQSFKNQFAISMMNMGGVGVLTGDQGQIRKNCRYVN